MLHTQALPADEARSVEALLRQLDFHGDELPAVDHDIAVDDAVGARLMTIPSVGDISCSGASFGGTMSIAGDSRSDRVVPAGAYLSVYVGWYTWILTGWVDSVAENSLVRGLSGTVGRLGASL